MKGMKEVMKEMEAYKAFSEMNQHGIQAYSIHNMYVHKHLSHYTNIYAHKCLQNKVNDSDYNTILSNVAVNRGPSAVCTTLQEGQIRV